MEERSTDKLAGNLSLVLKSLINAGAHNVNNDQLEILFSHLSKQDHADLLRAPAWDWVNESLDRLLNGFGGVHHTVVAFAFNLCAIIVERKVIPESQLKQTLEKVFQIVNDNENSLTPLIKLAHIRILRAISNLDFGMEWIKTRKLWLRLIVYSNRDQTLYVVRDASCLIYDILFTFSTKLADKDVCLEILEEIFKPIHQNVYEDQSVIINVDNKKTQTVLYSTLDLLSVIFQKTLETSEKNPVPVLCEEHHKLRLNLWKLAEMTHAKCFLGKILKAQTSYNFAMLAYKRDGNKDADMPHFNQFGVTFFNIMQFCIARKDCVNFLKLAKLNHLLWRKLGSLAPVDIFIENEVIRFESQLTMFHIMTLLCIVKSQPEEEGIFDQYIMKLFSISSDFTIRICYSFREILLNCPELAANLACKSIHEILSMKDFLDKEQAVVIFQALIYALKEFVCIPSSTSGQCNKSEQKRDLVLTIPRVLYAALVCLRALIEIYNITWKESIETVCVIGIVLAILNNSNLPPLTIVQAIKLTQISVEHFLSPNMALLVNNLKGSELQNIGPIIIKYLHNTEWEVRDTCLELVTSLVVISRLKFPAFQQYIIDNEICSIVFSITKNDQEAYVRASGLKCLGCLAAVTTLWEKCVSPLNPVDLLLDMIQHETEGIVRKEAISCLTQMYCNHRLTSTDCESFYDVLVQCAVNDLYWEAKVAALKFWEVELSTQFTEQGMIDGSFPTVTFSKENRKIVNLTETEITLRIDKILNRSSKIGCLHVMLECINDECDLEVVKAAVNLVNRLSQKLIKYNYRKAVDEECLDVGSTKNDSDSSTSGSESKINLDDNSGQQNDDNLKSSVINDITLTKDIQLLIDSYTNQLKVENPPSQSEPTNTPVKKSVVVKPSEFMDFLKRVDFNKLIEEHSNWFQCSTSLSSFLTDLILCNSIDKSVNADCY